MVIALEPADFADRVRKAKEAVLADTEFQRDDGWLWRKLEPMLSAINKALTRLGPVIRYALIAALVGLSFVLVAWIARRLLRMAHKGEACVPAATAPGTAAESSPSALKRAASEALSVGQFAESIKLSWMAVIALLDRARSGAGRRARADFEYVADARRAGAPEQPIAELATEFQRVRFGGTMPTQEAAARCLSSLDAVIAWQTRAETR